MIDAFIEIMDGLFWDGYTYQLAASDPKLFNYEYQSFLSAYDN